MEDTLVTEMQSGEEQPSDQLAPQGEGTYGVNNREAPKSIREAFDHLIKMFSLRDQYDRRIEVLVDRLLRFYDDGVQHVYPNFGTGVYQIGVSGGTIDVGNNQQVECPEYMGAYNIFRRDRRTLHAVLTQNPPGVDFISNKLGDPQGEQSAEIAEGSRHFFDQHNDSKLFQEEMSRYMCLSGRTVTRVYQDKNEQLWGTNDQGEPRTMETMWVGGTLETRVPITTRYVKDAVFVMTYEDKDVLLAKAQNPWIRSKIVGGEPGLGESEWERTARLGVKQARKGYYLTGTALAHLTSEMHIFLRPAAFEDIYCDAPFVDDPPDGMEFQPDEEGNITLRTVLLQLFPEGVHVKYIGKSYSESWNAALDDYITIGFPDVRDGMTGGALMEPAKVTQDTYNDYKNSERENYEKGWPATYFKGSANDYNAITDTRSAPARFHLLKESAPDQQIEGNIVYREPDFSVPESFVVAMEGIRQTEQPDLVGALPALAGNSKASQTASGQQMDRSQAMGMLGPAWANMQRMWSRIYTQVALLAAKNPDHGEQIEVMMPNGAKAQFQLKQIKKGTFKAKADVDSSFPDSTASKRASLFQMLPLVAPTPLGAALFQSPKNWEVLLEAFGNPDMELVPKEAYDKQMRELEVLLSQPPQDNSEAVQAYQMEHAQQSLTAESAGMPDMPYAPPPPQMPSLMPQPDDFHQWESAACADYLSSNDCWQRQTIGTPEQIQAAMQGIENVRLHKAVHDQMLAQQQAAMAATMAPAPQGKPGGGMNLPSPAAPSKQPGPTAPPGGGGPTI